MFRNGKVFLLLVLAVVLAGCNPKAEVRTDDAFTAAKKVFEANAKKANDSVGEIHFYKPAAMRVDKESNSQTIVLNQKSDSFYLTANPNEEKDSRVYYDLLLADEPDHLIGAQSFTKDEAFGFVAVIEKGENLVELIADAGGVKIETVTDEKNIGSHLERMMQIARSARQDDKR